MRQSTSPHTWIERSEPVEGSGVQHDSRPGRSYAEASTLVKWDSFSRELGRARTLGQVKELADKAKAVEVYCRNAKVGLPAVNTAITWWLRSARKAGGMLAKVERSRGTAVGRGRAKNRTSKALTTYQQTLEDIGLFNQTAHVWQQLAKIPEKNSRGF